MSIDVSEPIVYDVFLPCKFVETSLFNHRNRGLCKMRKSCRVILFILGIFPLMSTLVFGLPGLVNYKGRLTDPLDNPVAGPVNVTFTLWDAATEGTQLGTGFSDTDSVTPNADAIYDTLIGDDGGPLIPISVFKNDSVWLNVNVGGEDLVPRTRLTPTGSALHAHSADTATSAVTAGDADTVDGLDASAFIESSASSYVVVKPTDNAMTNGANLIAAYATAKALTPHGQALGADNRAVVLVPPGKYDLGSSQLDMDTQYVDLVGLSTARENQHMYGTANGAGTGVIRQTANDVKIENIFVELMPTGYETLIYDDQDPAAYFPDTPLASTVVRNCLFVGDDVHPYSGFSMRLGIEYAGQYEGCTGGRWSYGRGGYASGNFISCTGGYGSFGAYGDASGSFKNCTGGERSFGYHGIASGTFNNCIAEKYSFGYQGTASGNFTGCIGGVSSFGRLGDASGTFNNCIGGVASFGYDGIASGIFNNCNGGSSSFGSGSFGTAEGTFSNCTGGSSSFGHDGNATGGRFYFCSGGVDSFTTNGSPTVIHCIRDGVPYP
jgi:hypothetical protein